MQIKNVKYILTDIEGTTTSISFVYDTLFPYFRKHIFELKELTHLQEVQEAFKKTVELAYSLEGKKFDQLMNGDHPYYDALQHDVRTHAKHREESATQRSLATKNM